VTLVVFIPTKLCAAVSSRDAWNPGSNTHYPTTALARIHRQGYKLKRSTERCKAAV
jgi:hypothetical protein